MRPNQGRGLWDAKCHDWEAWQAAPRRPPPLEDRSQPGHCHLPPLRPTHTPQPRLGPRPHHPTRPRRTPQRPQTPSPRHMQPSRRRTHHQPPSTKPTRTLTNGTISTMDALTSEQLLHAPLPHGWERRFEDVRTMNGAGYRNIVIVTSIRIPAPNATESPQTHANTPGA